LKVDRSLLSHLRGAFYSDLFHVFHCDDRYRPLQHRLRPVSRLCIRKSNQCCSHQIGSDPILRRCASFPSVSAFPSSDFAHVIVISCWFVARSALIRHRSDVDECLESSVCGEEGCQNTIGSYICMGKSVKDAPYVTCPPGYQWESRTGMCEGK